ncbi:MAG TPA: GAF domain-containing protein [Polyangiaceae bacterium]|nr:GAF domain-containing protein [Polyangiaceae bacterium]
MVDAPDPERRLELVAALATRVASTEGLERRIRVALELLDTTLGYDHTMLLVPDGTERLVMLSCRGYPSGGTGAELRLGEGPIGVAAERRVPVTLANLPLGFRLMRSVQGQIAAEETRILLPGLVDASSAIAVPAVDGAELVLVLYAEDTAAGRYGALDASVLQIVANQLAAHVHAEEDEPVEPPAVTLPGPYAIVARYFDEDGSVFFGNDYVIKSLPGRILWKLLREYLSTGRTEFTKKELRLDASLGLPPVRDNLDTRLILLRRRLEERFPFVRVEAAGRGRLRLRVEGELRLEVHPCLPRSG